MITRQQIMEFFRGDDLSILSEWDKEEIMVACCDQSQHLEELVEEAIEKEHRRLREKDGND